MTIVDNGINRTAALVEDDIYSSHAGTSQTVVSTTDTDLYGEVSAVEDTSPSVVRSDDTITVTYVIPSTLGNGSTFYEWGTKMNSGSTLLDRALSAGLAKTSAIEVTRIITYKVERG